MRGRWGLAALAAAVAASVTGVLGGAARAADTACELPRMDRARTPSIACMRCHGAGIGPDIGFQMRGGSLSHPVDVDYADAAARHPGSYAPAASLPPDVPLVDGRIECTTCHDGALATRKWVVDESRLCYACHVM